MSPLPSVSVVLSAKNRKEFVLHCLDHLGRQSFPAERMEVVLVDDRSTDHVLDAVGARQYPFRLTTRRVEGDPSVFALARAKNVGFAAATGEVIVSFDADVMAGPEFVASHVAPHHSIGDPVVVIGYTYGCGGYERKTAELSQVPPMAEIVERLPDLLRDEPEKWLDGRDAYYRAKPEVVQGFLSLTSPWTFCWGGNFSFGRALLEKTGGFDENYRSWGGEDIEFAYRLFAAGARFCIRRQAWGVHYPHPAGDTKANLQSNLHNMRRMVRKHPLPAVEIEIWRNLAVHVGLGGVQLSISRANQVRDQARSFVRDVARPSLDTSQLAEVIAHLESETILQMPYVGLGPRDLWPASLDLIGLLTPWESGELRGALLVGYERCPGECLAMICAELVRAASTVFLLQVPEPEPMFLRTAEELGLRVAPVFMKEIRVGSQVSGLPLAGGAAREVR